MNPATITIILTAIQQAFEVLDRIRTNQDPSPEYLAARKAVRQELVKYANSLGAPQTAPPPDDDPDS